MFGDIYDKVVPKPSKASGTRWIAHKVRAMEIVLSNYGIFITHLESLSQTDSQVLVSKPHKPHIFCLTVNSIDCERMCFFITL